MAKDSLGITQGVGRNVATDVIGDIDHQLVKIIIGDYGTDDGPVSDNNPIPVKVTNTLTETEDGVAVFDHGADYMPGITSSRVICGQPCKLKGIFVSAASSTPTIKLWDNASAGSGNVLVDQFTPVAGQYYAFPSRRAIAGIYITIGGTVTCSADFAPDTV